VSEALANVAKYANATSALIELTRRNGLVRVEVSDDGIGGASVEGGSGLRGLQDRVAAVGGRLEVQSPPGGGTRVVAEMPADG
jgi:signal transduction histidine kinase